MKIYKNFLPQETFQGIKRIIAGPDFPWYFNNEVISLPGKNPHFQFVHTFYTQDKENSTLIELLAPIIQKFKPLTLLRVKANLLTRTEKHVEHGYHVDYSSSKSAKITTGIFYLNTNNGYTKFKNGKKIKSIENTFVEFKADEQHTGASCTDEKSRIVINFNYIKFENNF
jgi:hypothetical protein|tara:strand:+ start:68 stop:577 length:510 start_codon:yes stop_codon:yes gene_type:complete